MPSFYTAVGGAVVGGRTGSTPTAPLLAVGTGAQYLHRTGTRSRLAATVFTRVGSLLLPHFKLREKNGVRLILRCAWQKEYQGTLEEKEIEREMEGR